MTIQHCPIEVLDRIFEWVAFLSPEKAPAALSSVMMVCSHFQKVAKRHLIRIICLSTTEKVVAFGSFLKGAVNSGEYATSFLPIEHLALLGNFRILRTLIFEISDAEVEAEHLELFIISTAAPSLRSLTLFAITGGHRPYIVDDQTSHLKMYVLASLKFPLLHDLVALEQTVLGPINGQTCRSRYPSLKRLYVPGNYYDGGLPPSALLLPNLDCLRLQMLDSGHATILPREHIQHVRSLIIDGPRYSRYLFRGGLVEIQSQDEYNTRMLEYRAPAEEIGGLNGSGVLVPPEDHTCSVNSGRILLGWSDAVDGGAGCWSMDWRPTIPRG